MKIYVCNVRKSNNRVYVEGIRHKKDGDKFISIPFSTSFDSQYFADNVKSPKFPFILDISLVKGKGAVFNGKEI